MSVDSKLFVTLGSGYMFEVMEAVTRELNHYSRVKLDEYIENETDYINRAQYKASEHEKKFTNGVSFFGYTPDVITFKFGSGDSLLRCLKMFPDTSYQICDNYREISKEEKISFSIGKWGASDEIMEHLIEALRCMADVYYMPSDSNDEWVKYECKTG